MRGEELDPEYCTHLCKEDTNLIVLCIFPVSSTSEITRTIHMPLLSNASKTEKQ